MGFKDSHEDSMIRFEDSRIHYDDSRIRFEDSRIRLQGFKDSLTMVRGFTLEDSRIRGLAYI